VVADLSIDNPNVWYELGVRHALRARGVVILSGGQTPTAFDLYTDRKVRYGLKDGGPDPDTIEDDKRKLTDMVKATMESWHGRKVSPVYNLMPNLQEPDWKKLRIGDVREFWEQHDAWDNRLGLARKVGASATFWCWLRRRRSRPFAPTHGSKPARRCLRPSGSDLHSNTWIRAGDRAENLRALQGRAYLSQRLALAGVPGHSLDRARALPRTLKLYPTDAETWALLGRVDKDAWVAAWHQRKHAREDARGRGYEDALLRAAIESYARAYRGSGPLLLRRQCADPDASAGHLTNDPRYNRDIATMAGAVRYAAEWEPDPNQRFWSKTTLGDLEVLVGTPDTVKAAYKEAIAKNEKDWFALNSSRAQLQLLQDLGFRPDTVAAGIATFDRALGRLTKPEDRWEPRQVLLFSGHMVDAPDRKTPRFPADKEAAAAQSIGGALERLGAGPEDLAFAKQPRAATVVPRGMPSARRALQGAAAVTADSSKNRLRPRLVATSGAIAFTP
jgi:hypothetical protein